MCKVYKLVFLGNENWIQGSISVNLITVELNSQKVDHF